jgi:hypothetical protein
LIYHLLHADLEGYFRAGKTPAGQKEAPEMPETGWVLSCTPAPLLSPEGLRGKCSVMVIISRGYEQYPLMQTLAGRSVHNPPKQIWSGGQEFEHVPQLNLSLKTSTHVPLQKVRPTGHRHIPLKQLIPGGQAFPHEPQLRVSNLVSLHVPLQRARPARHEHLPFMQAA